MKKCTVQENKMKTFYQKYKFLVLLFGIFFFFVAVVPFIASGCSYPPPVLTVGEDRLIDLESEKFDIFDGVSAKDGKGKNIDGRIKVSYGNGVTVENGQASFPATGDYKFEYKVTDRYGKSASAEVTVCVRNIYSVYLTNATLPPLYCALDMADNGYKFIFFNDRVGTVDVTVYGDRALGDYKESQADYEAALDVFYNIYESDDNSYFRIFFPDARNQNLLKYVVKKGIAEDRYAVKYLSDGSMSYSTSFPYRGEDAYDNWSENTALYNGMLSKAEAGEDLIFNDINLGESYMDYQLHNAYIYAAQKENAEFWGAYPETLQSSDEKVQAEIDKANLIKKQPEKMYQKLTVEQREKFLASVSLDKSRFDEDYFSAEGKYLIITGTSPVYGSFSSEQFTGLLDKILREYEGYNVLFKPHPAAIPSETVCPEVYAYMVQNRIKILPGRLPMEVLSWVYGDSLIGGFDSSLYMSIPQGNTAFFIAENKDDLSAVSLMLYESGAFGDIKFYWVD